MTLEKISIFILLATLSIGCNTKNESVTDTKEIFQNNKSSIVQANSQDTTKQCSCAKSNVLRNLYRYSTDISFENNPYVKNRDETNYLKYSADSLRNNIKSIRFTKYDTIPSKYFVFKNVEYIVIDGKGKIVGLDNFPNLRGVFFWGAQIEIDTSDKWLQKIEAIYAEKSIIKNLETFKKTPNLQEIYFGHAKLEPFPKDLNVLQCLRKIQLGAYRGNIDLSKFDLASFPCLEKVEFSTWYDAFSGIPKGIDTSRTFELIINHQKLTEEEKLKINNYNHFRNKKTE
jgi:hypothetical protein